MKMWEAVLRSGAWRWLELLGGRGTVSVLGDARSVGALSESERDSARLARLRQVVEQAVETVPYYRDLVARQIEVTRWDDLNCLPVVGKDELRKDASAFVSSKLTGEPGKSVSGGSTGAPVTSFTDPEASAMVKAALIEGRALWNIHPWSRCLSVWGHSKYLGAGWKGNLKLRKQRLLDVLANRRIIPAYDLSAGAVLRFNRCWHRDHPRYIIGYASALYEIARLHRELELPIPDGDCVVMSTGEVLHDWQAELIEEVMKCRVIEEYGLVEAGAVAYSDPDGNGLKVLTSHFVVEILDDHGVPVKEGEEGRVVISSLRRLQVPVLRYDTGDRAVCIDAHGGRDCQRISKVAGRTYDIIRRADRSAAPGVIFTHALKSLADVRRFEVVQRKLGGVEISYIAPADLSPEVVEEVVGNIQSEVGPEFEVEMRRVERLETATSGKYRWIRSELAESSS